MMQHTNGIHKTEHDHLRTALFPTDWTVCARCRLIHHPQTPCPCTPALRMEDEPSPVHIPAWVIWRWVVLGMVCGVVFALACWWAG